MRAYPRLNFTQAPLFPNTNGQHSHGALARILKSQRYGGKKKKSALRWLYIVNILGR